MEKSQGWDPGELPREQEHPDITSLLPPRTWCVPFSPLVGIHHPPQGGKKTQNLMSSLHLYKYTSLS